MLSVNCHRGLTERRDCSINRGLFSSCSFLFSLCSDFPLSFHLSVLISRHLPFKICHQWQMEKRRGSKKSRCWQVKVTCFQETLAPPFTPPPPPCYCNLIDSWEEGKKGIQDESVSVYRDFTEGSPSPVKNREI